MIIIDDVDYKVVVNIFMFGFAGLGGILTIQKGRVTHKVLPDNIEINRQRTPKKLNKFYEKIKSVIRDKPCLVGLGIIIADSIDDWFTVRYNYS